MTRELDRIHFVTRHFNDLQGLRYWVPLGLITLSVGGTTYFSSPWMTLLRALLFSGACLLVFGARRYYRNTFGEVEPQPVVPTAHPDSVSIYSPAGATPRLASFRRRLPAPQLLITMGLALALFLTLRAISPRVGLVEDESLVQPPWEALSVPMVMFDTPTGFWDDGPSTIKAAFGQTLYALYGSFFLGLWLWRGRRLSQSYHLVFGVLLLGLSAFGSCLGFLIRGGENIPGIALSAVVHLWVALLLCGVSMILAGLLDHRQLVGVMGRRVED